MHINWPFTSHMVLQRNQTIHFSGCSNNSYVKIQVDEDIYETNVVNKKWSVDLYFDEVGGPFSIRVMDEEETVVLDDLYVGDVFLAGGQSNMEFKVKEGLPSAFECKGNVRYLHVPRYVYEKEGKLYPEEERKNWQVLDDQSYLELSAVAYYFCQHLPSDIPIGIIDLNKGGTSASCWLSEDVLKSDPVLKKTYIDGYYEDVHTTLEEQYQATCNYNQKLNNYLSVFNNYKQQHPEMSVAQMKYQVGHTPWPPAKGHFDFRRPSGLYEYMLKSVFNYPISAVLWYQGEEDSLRPKHYKRLMVAMIACWRREYGREVPFFILQLPEYDGMNIWHFGLIRIIQWQLAQDVKDVYLVPLLGCGEKDNVHPVDKRIAGYRLAESVKHDYYHISGSIRPKLVSHAYDGHTLTITFDQPLKETTLQVNARTSKGMIKVSLKARNEQLICTVDDLVSITYGDEDYFTDYIVGINDIPISPFTITI